MLEINVLLFSQRTNHGEEDRLELPPQGLNVLHSCARVLAPRNVDTREEIDARKERYGDTEALSLLKGMTTLLVAKGKKVTRVDLRKDRPDDDTLVALMLGPTGNLRAPTMKVGKTVLIGFNDEIYGEVFG